MRILIHIILLLLSCIAITGYAQDKKHYLGILEEIAAFNYPKQTYLRQIRVLFYKDNNQWKTISDSNDSQYPSETIWTIAFDGKNLGKLKGQKKEIGVDNSSSWLNVGVQKIINKENIPTFRKKTAYFNGSKVHSPLVVNSMPYYTDPEKWKPSTLPPEVMATLRQEFRKKFPHVENCERGNAAGPLKLWAYKDSDIKIYQSYSAKTGWSIAGLYLIDRCDNPRPQGPFLDQWFAISPTHQIQFLRAGMTLVDAGDYDHSGKSELIFSLEGYNRYGYAIFYDDFQKSAVFENSFH